MRYLALIPLILTGLTITGCLERGDSDPSAAPPVDSTVTPNSFLTFVNQSLDVDSEAYANAYYAAVDPLDERTTLADWKTRVEFSQGNIVHATFRDTKDLGYGRDMYAKTSWNNCDTCVAVYVDNYIVEIEAGDATSYGPLNLDAAIEQDREFLFGTNVIEFSHEDDNPSKPKILKFFTYAPEDNSGVQWRLTAADLDGRGVKHMPMMCVVCHGGTLYPLTRKSVNDGGALTFDPISLKSPKMNMLEQHTLQFSSTPGYTETDQEPAIAVINRMVYESYRESGTRADTNNSTTADDTDDDQANWRSDFAEELVEGAYGDTNLGDDVLEQNTTYQADFVPAGWAQTGSRPGGVEVLYKQVIEPHCIGCHSSRGTMVAKNNNDANGVNFSSYEEFIAYNDLIIDYVYRRGSMPRSLINFSQFWDDPDGAPTLLATYLAGFDVFDGNGNVVMPGKAVAKPGADRTVKSTPVELKATASLFSATYSWRIVSPTDNSASLDDLTSSAPQLNAGDGDVVLELTTSNANGNSEPAQVTITVDSTTTIPENPTFVSDISAILQTNCAASCHSSSLVTPPNTLAGIPIYYDQASYTDGNPKNLYQNVLNRVDLVDPENSLLLRKPTNAPDTPHGGDLVLDRTDPNQDNLYITILNWIRNGAPCGNDATLCD